MLLKIMFSKIKFSRVLLFFLLIIFLTQLDANNLLARKSKKNTKSSKSPYRVTEVRDTTLSDGVRYKKLLISHGRVRHMVHVTEVDLTDTLTKINVFKSGMHSNALEKLPVLVHNSDSIRSLKILSAINANFWRAYTNNAIGPLISDGEVIELVPYKEWSSMFFDKNGVPYIDNFKTSASFKSKNGNVYEINAFNRRSDSSQIVVYNKYFGISVPKEPEQLNDSLMHKLYEETVSIPTYNDSTEEAISFEEFKDFRKQSLIEESLEFGVPKIAAVYLDKPAINKKVRALVTAKDTGSIIVPAHGVIVSLGKSLPEYNLPKVGDTISLKISTDSNENIMFTDAVCGTPRLVRNGIASHEARQEGSRSRRFINRRNARTAIGYNQNKTKFYFVAIEVANGEYRAVGANLAETASIMKAIGAYNAMNLDGGGSTIMIAGGENVMHPNNPEHARRISAALGVVKRKIQ